MGQSSRAICRRRFLYELQENGNRKPILNATSEAFPSLPRFDVNYPPGLSRLVLEMSQIHRRSSMLRRSPTCRANALLNLGAETGRLHGR